MLYNIFWILYIFILYIEGLFAHLSKFAFSYYQHLSLDNREPTPCNVSQAQSIQSPVLCLGQSRYQKTGPVGKNSSEPDPELPENLSQF